MEESNKQYLPFHAINEFMLDEYRSAVIEKVLHDLNSLSGPRKGKINALIKNNVNIPGFRNSANAPASMKLQDSVKLFKRNPAFVAQVLGAWSELLDSLYSKVFQMLDSRGWELHPMDVDRSSLPGFLAEWDKEETYDVLDEAFAQMYPDLSDISEDDVRLMVVWVSARLPYDLFDTDDDEEEMEG